MLDHMMAQTRRLHKRFVTHPTHLLFFARVNAHVHLESPQPRIALPAHLTLVLLLARVSHQVVVQCTLVVEQFLTHRALDVLLAHMNASDVLFEVTVLYRLEVAHSAFVFLFTVSFVLMLMHLSSGRKFFFAYLARKFSMDSA